MAERDSKTIYPPVSFHFAVEFNIDGVEAAAVDTEFQEVSGFNQELATEELAEGGENRFSYRLPKRGKYGNLILKRGLMTSSKIVDWITDAIDNFTFKPSTVAVTLLNEAHEPLVRWEFLAAYPVKWSSADLKSTENAILIETLELSYQYFTKTYVS